MTDALVEAVEAAIEAAVEADSRDTECGWQGAGTHSAVARLKRITATAALQAIEAAGYRVVPVEATRAMRLAGEQEMMARHTNLDCFRDPYVDSTYAAMLSAAPRVGEG